MDWELEIKKADNGYILKGRFGDSEQVSYRIIEEEDDEDGELKAMEKLLYEVKEYFGVYYSKHNKKNLIIEIKEGLCK